MSYPSLEMYGGTYDDLLGLLKTELECISEVFDNDPHSLWSQIEPATFLVRGYLG
jgi:hypothetical protein